MFKSKKVYPSILHRVSTGQMMVIGFGFVILVGAILLSLPISSIKGQYTNFLNCLFTSTSAVCVTGLVVVDTSTYWSVFGKFVIIMLIQIGGIGFMSISTLIALVLRRKINLRERLLIKEALNQNEIAGAVVLVVEVIKFTLITELIGAIFLSIVFIPKFGVVDGIGFSFFHSISAFCNAGFDLLGGTFGRFSSLNHYYNNSIIVFTISTLIILGGIGFPVLINIKNQRKFSKLRLSSKLAIITTIILIVAGVFFIYIGEFNNNNTIANMSFFDKFKVAYFQSVTTRTAGFATFDLSKFRESTLFIMIILMFLGASPASTGGGIKTTTVAIIFLAVKAFLKNENEITAFHRRINIFTFRKALGVFVIGITIAVISTYLLVMTQDKNFNLLNSAFEVTSAFATVGLSLGGSQNLNIFGKILIILLMFAGRVGSITIFASLLFEKNLKKVRYAEEKVLVG